MPIIGIITCEILELEFAHVLANDPQVSGVAVLESPHGRGLIEALERNGCPAKCMPSIEQSAWHDPGELGVLIQVMEVGLHTVILDLRNSVTEAARAMGPHVDAILLGYGLCGNALENPQALLSEAGVPIFIPMDEDHPVDDCVGLIIGGRESYYEEQCKVAGTFFVNSGFSRHWKTIMHKSHGKRGYNPAIAKRLMAGYERSLLLPTPVCSAEELAENIAEFNWFHGLRTEARAGTLELFQKTWDDTKAFVLAGPQGPSINS